MSTDDAEFAAFDATMQAELVARGQVQPAELVESAIRRIERVDAELGSVIHRCFDEGRSQLADALGEGPFRGVPFLMKDIGGEEAGRPLCAGLRAARQAKHRAAADSHFAERIRAAGLVSLGRTNTPELALMPTTEPEAFGPTRNPWHLDHSAGGSSGGAAAAVAAGLVPVAHASDGGGSIRGPASMCGLVGLKPTRGRNSFGPGIGERWSGFSCEFVVSRSVRDSATLLDATAGRMPGDPYSALPPAGPFSEAPLADTRGLRIGVMRHAPRDIELHPDVLAAVDDTARTLEDLGHHVELAHPEALDEPDIVRLYVDVVCANVARALDAWSEKLGQVLGEADVEPLTWALAERGRTLSAAHLLASLEGVHGFGRRLAGFFGQGHEAQESRAHGGFDLLLTPTQAQPPPALGHLAQTPELPLGPFLKSAPYGVFTLPFNLSGQPAISLPGHFTRAGGAGPEGLPIGVQLVADQNAEFTLLDVAAQIERAAPGRSAAADLRLSFHRVGPAHGRIHEPSANAYTAEEHEEGRGLLRLVIFDCDGVLVDTEPEANRVLVEMLREVGLELELDESMKLFRGRSMSACWAIIEARMGRPLPPGFDGEFARREHAALARLPLRMPGLEEALDGIDALGLATCVASSGAHAKMRVTLGGAGLLERFEGRIFSATSDVERGKPYPDVFEHAAATLGFATSECVVVEDSALGVEAGRAAGMRVLGFAREVAPDVLAAAGAEVFVDLLALPGLIEAMGTPAVGES